MSARILDKSNRAVRAEVGSPAPDFALRTNQDTTWRLSDHLGSVTVLLFYPQNETLVCTKQLCSVRDNWENYVETKATIVGISPATPTEQQAFSHSLRLPIRLLSDPGRKITSIYAGHRLLPLSFTRAIVVIDANGVIRNRDVMLRAFRPSDAKLITNIYAARGDAFNDEYHVLKNRIEKSIKTSNDTRLS